MHLKMKRIAAALVSVCMAVAFVPVAPMSAMAICYDPEYIPSSEGVTNPAESITVSPRDALFYLYAYGGANKLSFPAAYDYYEQEHQVTFTLVGKDPTKPCDDNIKVFSTNTCDAKVKEQDSASRTCTIIQGAYDGPVSIHVVASSGADMYFKVNSVTVPAQTTISESAVSLAIGDTTTLETNSVSNTWESSDSSVATVNKTGLVTAVSPGTAIITTRYNKYGLNQTATCKVTVAAGTVTVGKAQYKVTGTKTVAFAKDKSASKSVTIPASIKVSGKSFDVTAVSAKAFASSKATTVVVKSAKMTTFKNAFKGSKVKTVKVPAKSKSAYKKLLTKSTCGAKVTVK